MALSRGELTLVLRARDEASRTLHAMGRSIRGLDKDALAAANRSIERGRALTSVGFGIAAAGAAGIVGLNAAANAAIEYEQSAAKALTQVDGINVSLQQMEDLGLSVAKKIPVPFEQIQPALYDIFSSIDTNLAGSRKLIIQFSKDAVAANTDLQTVTQGSIRVMNAFRVPVKDVSKVSDFMFQTVRKGIGDYNQFTEAIGRSAPAAANAGQSYQELGAMLTFLTRQGLTTSRAGSSAARALQAIANPKTVERLEDMGIQVEKANGEFRPMSKIMKDLGKEMEDLTGPERAKALQELFKSSGGTIQARRFFDAALENMDKYQKNVQWAMDNKDAARDAFDIMKDTDAAKVQALANAWETFKVKIGDAASEIKANLAGALSMLLNLFNSLPAPVIKIIGYVAAFTAALAVVIGVITAVAGVIMMVSGAAAILGISLGALVAIGAGVVAAIAAVIAIFVILAKNWDSIKPKIQPVWDAFMRGAKAVGGWIKDNVIETLKTLKKAAQDAWGWIKDNFGKDSKVGKAFLQLVRDIKEEMPAVKKAVKDALEEMGAAWDEFSSEFGSEEDWSNFKTTIQGVFAFVKLHIQSVIILLQSFAAMIGPVFSGIAGAVSSAFQGILKIIQGAAQIINGLIGWLTSAITLDWAGMKQNGVMIVQGFVNLVIGLFKLLVEAPLRFISGMVEGVIKFFQKMYNRIVGNSIVPDMINGIVRWFAKLPVLVVQAVLRMYTRTVQYFAKMAVRAAAAAGRLVSRVVGQIKKLPGRVASFVSSMVSRVVGFFGRMASQGASRAANLVGRVVGSLAKLPGRAAGAISSIVGRVASTLGRAMSRGVAAVASGVGRIASAAGRIPGRVVSALGGLAGQMAAAGRNAISGFIGGMGSMLSSVTSKAASIAKSAINAAKSALKIGSPSKVMHRIGRWVTRGFARGIQRDADDVKDAVNKLVDKIRDALGDKNIGRGRARNLIRMVRRRDNVLKRLARQDERNANRIKKARDKIHKQIDERRSYWKKIRDSAVSFANISNIEAPTDVFGEKGVLTTDSLINTLKGRLSTLDDYRKGLEKLRKQGLNKTMYRQLVEAGVEGGGDTVKALQSASKEQISQINKLSTSIGKSAKTMGLSAAAEFYNSGVASSRGFLKGLLRKDKRIDRATRRYANRLVRSIKKRLRIKSPSQVFRDIGQNLSEAVALGLTDQLQNVRTAAARLEQAASINPTATYSSTPLFAGGSNSAPVVSDSGRPPVEQNITINTQEIDPRKHAADLGFELANRMT